MKRVILITAIAFAIVTTSCKSDHKHGPDTHEHEKQTEMKAESDSDKKDVTMTNAYKCPMDCEKGKIYDKEGNCAVCKMNLKKVEKKEGDHDEKKEHSHNEDTGHSH